jgi:hypothetical protein
MIVEIQREDEGKLEDAVNKLLEFLRNVDESTARQLWLWLDADPNALDRMICAVVDSHKFEHPGNKREVEA